MTSTPLSSMAADDLTVTVSPRACTSSTLTSPPVEANRTSRRSPPADTDNAVNDEPVDVNVTFPSTVETSTAVSEASTAVAFCSNVTYAPVPMVLAVRVVGTAIVLSIVTKPPSPVVAAEMLVATTSSSSRPDAVPLISSTAVSSTTAASMSVPTSSTWVIDPELLIAILSPSATNVPTVTSRDVGPAVVTRVMSPISPAAFVPASMLVAVMSPPPVTDTEPLNVLIAVSVIASVSSIVMSPVAAVMFAVRKATVVSTSIEPSVPATAVFTVNVAEPESITTSACRSPLASMIPPSTAVRLMEPVPPTMLVIRPTGMSPATS